MKSEEDSLLDACEVSAFRSSGKGGQHVNKTDSAVRLRHLPTGIVVTCQSERSQYLNKRKCLEKLRRKIAMLSYRPPKRIPTVKPKSAKQRTLKKKARRREVKQMRKIIFDGE